MQRESSILPWVALLQHFLQDAGRVLCSLTLIIEPLETYERQWSYGGPYAYRVIRNLNQDIETIINKSESVTELKKESNDRDLTPKEKETLSDDEKEYKSMRKQIQEKLIKFATRIPVLCILQTIVSIVWRILLRNLSQDFLRRWQDSEYRNLNFWQVYEFLIVRLWMMLL
jgi:hypothetical protein